MAKKNKVTINNIDTIIETCNITEHEITYGDITIKVKPSIKLNEYSQMIKDITLMIFDVTTGEYSYDYNTFAVQYQIINYFTNITTTNIAKVFDLVNNTDIMDKISAHIKPTRDVINNDVNNAIDFIKQTAFHSSPWDEVAEMIKGTVDNLQQTTSKLSEVKGEDITKLIGLFGNITQNDIKDIALKKMIADGKS